MESLLPSIRSGTPSSLDHFICQFDLTILLQILSRQTLFMVAYLLCLRMLSTTLTLAMGGRAIRWRIYDATFSIPAGNVHQAIDLAWLRFFVNGFRYVGNRFVVAMTSPGQCVFPYLVNMFFTFQMLSCTTLSRNF